MSFAKNFIYLSRRLRNFYSDYQVNTENFYNFEGKFVFTGRKFVGIFGLSIITKKKKTLKNAFFRATAFLNLLKAYHWWWPMRFFSTSFLTMAFLLNSLQNPSFWYHTHFVPLIFFLAKTSASFFLLFFLFWKLLKLLLRLEGLMNRGWKKRIMKTANKQHLSISQK